MTQPPHSLPSDSASPPNSTAELLARIAAGLVPDYMLFWGHRQPRDKLAIGKTCLSQWYESAFEVAGVRYATAEHYMMAEKARLFGDEASAARIVAAPDPGAAKALGRKIAGFEEAPWLARRSAIVEAGNIAKFSQQPRLRAYLLGTGERMLVEASPMDAIWGVGVAADDPRAIDPAQWPGLNLLGFALMQVRARLRAAG